MPRAILIVGIVLQVLAHTFLGVWAPLAAGILIGVAIGLAGGRGGFRVGALSAIVAVTLLLAMVGVRGADVVGFADRIGANFRLPAWGVLLVAVLLPALQAGGVAGGVARVITRDASGRPSGR